MWSHHSASKPRASSGFIYRAGSCQAHRPQGWSVNGKEDFTPTPGFSKNHQTTVTKSLGLSLCEIPAAVLFKELTWHWYNVRSSTKRTTFDLGIQIWKCRLWKELLGGWKDEKQSRSSRWLGRCWGMGVTQRCQWHHSPRCRTCPKGDKMRWCVKQEGAEFQQGPRQAPLSFCLWGDDLAINSPAKVGRIGGKSRFWLLYAWQPCFYKMGCWKPNRA